MSSLKILNYTKYLAAELTSASPVKNKSLLYNAFD